MGKQTIGADGYTEDMDVEGINLTVTYPTMGLNLSLVPQTDLQKALGAGLERLHRRDTAAEPPHEGHRHRVLEGRSRGRGGTQPRGHQVAPSGRDDPHPTATRRTWAPKSSGPSTPRPSAWASPVCFHGNSWGAEGQDRWETFLQAHTVSFSFEIMQAFLGVVTSGLMERFQNLKVGFFEAGCGWLPYWLDRIDEHYERRSEEAPLLKAKAQRVRHQRAGVRELRPRRRHAALLHGPLRRRPVAVRRGLPHWDTIWPNATRKSANAPTSPTPRSEKSSSTTATVSTGWGWRAERSPKHREPEGQEDLHTLPKVHNMKPADMQEPDDRRPQPVKFRFGNIGPVKDATLELGDLTVIAGRNNTGKTYIVYSLYGFLKMWRGWPYAVEFMSNQPEARFPDLSSIADNLIQEGRAEFPLDGETLDRQRRILTQAVASVFSKVGLSSVFSSQRGDFKGSFVKVELNGGVRNNVHSFRASFPRVALYQSNTTETTSS